MKCEFEVCHKEYDGTSAWAECPAEGTVLVEIEDLAFGDGVEILPYCERHAEKAVREAAVDPSWNARVVS